MRPSSENILKSFFKIIIYAFIGLFLFIIAAILLWWNSIKTQYQITEHTDKIYGSISFRGSVIKIHHIKRGGRIYGLMCVQIDSSNTYDFYRFDEFTCLKIKDSIASMPIGFIGNQSTRSVSQILNSAYVEVNLNQNKKVVYYNSNRDTISKNLYYRNNNLKKEDLSICNKYSGR